MEEDKAQFLHVEISEIKLETGDSPRPFRALRVRRPIAR